MIEVKAKSESAFSLGKIDYAKRWVTRILNTLQTALLAGGDKLDLTVFNKHNAQFQDQCDKILALVQVIGDIYAKHKVQTHFETISNNIDDYLEQKQIELNAFAAKVDGGASPEAPISRADLLAALTLPTQEHIKVNIDCPKFKGDEADRLEFKNWFEKIDVIVKSRSKWSNEYKLFFS